MVAVDCHYEGMVKKIAFWLAFTSKEKMWIELTRMSTWLASTKCPLWAAEAADSHQVATKKKLLSPNIFVRINFFAICLAPTEALYTTLRSNGRHPNVLLVHLPYQVSQLPTVTQDHFNNIIGTKSSSLNSTQLMQDNPAHTTRQNSKQLTQYVGVYPRA